MVLVFVFGVWNLWAPVIACVWFTLAFRLRWHNESAIEAFRLRESERNRGRVGKREAAPVVPGEERPPIRQHVVDALARAAIASLRIGNQVPETAAPAPKMLEPVFPGPDTTPKTSPESSRGLPSDQRFAYSRKKALILRHLDDLLAAQEKLGTSDSVPEEENLSAPAKFPSSTPPRTKV